MSHMTLLLHIVIVYMFELFENITVLSLSHTHTHTHTHTHSQRIVLTSIRTFQKNFLHSITTFINSEQLLSWQHLPLNYIICLITLTIIIEYSITCFLCSTLYHKWSWKSLTNTPQWSLAVVVCVHNAYKMDRMCTVHACSCIISNHSKLHQCRETKCTYM